MITYVRGNLFESPAQVLVNTVNTVGVMGKGVALEFKRLFPEMFREYQQMCEQGRLEIGRLHLFRTPGKWVLNFPTKKHWRQPSRTEYIRAGLQTFVRMYSTAGIHSVAFPPLGCGHGQLDFAHDVRPLMEQYLRRLPIAVFIYPEKPLSGTPEHLDVANMRKWLQSEPASLPFHEVWDQLLDLIGRERWFATRSRGTPFRVQAVEEPPTLLVESGRKRYKVGQNELLDFWQQLREYGFSFRRVAAEHWRVHYLVPVFAELPYVDRVEVSESQEGLQKNAAYGLQVRPPTQPTEKTGDLFAPRV